MFLKRTLIYFVGMKLLFHLFTFCTLPYILYAQKEDTITLNNGLCNLTIFHHSGSDSLSRISVLNLHENEHTSIEAFLGLDQSKNFPFTFLHQYGRRNIAYCKDDLDTIYFDPNRIFSPAGITNTLVTNSRFDSGAFFAAQHLGHLLIDKIQTSKFILALHNNSPGNYSVNSYKRNAEYANDAEKVYTNPTMDADDFVYTNDETIFKWFKKNRANIVLQNNDHVTDDGSLSVFFRDRKAIYINIEAEHGHLAEQQKLILLFLAFLKQD
jgi:hypothetical protein